MSNVAVSVPAEPWWRRLGLCVDRLLNVLLFGGLDTETVSLHAAEAEQAGKRWGCWTCWLLARLVQRDHCAITLSNQPEAAGAALRAGLIMAVVIGLPAWVLIHFF